MFYRPITDRLVLKLPTVLDTQEVFALIDKNRDHIGAFMPWVQHILTAEDERKYLAEASGHLNPEAGAIPVFLILDGRIIGAAGLNAITKETKCVEIGYWISAEHEGKGYVTAAVRELEKMSFTELGLERIQITNDVANLRSRAIPERLGYHLDGILRRHALSGGDRIVDRSVYSILRPEWEAREAQTTSE